jgi:phenylalanyl-tRNA synthetase beta chain
VKLPISWLQRFIDVSDLSLDDLLDVMSLNGLEVEEVHRPGAGTEGVRTKRVVSWEPHPDADRLRVVRVTDGDTETELVCGASNFDDGDVVAHAEVGATIPGDDGPFRLEARPLRGVVSNGMLCSARELHLGDDHSGIMVLAPDTPLGVDLREVLPVGEPVIEVAVLADRGDHHSVLGIARELGAILDRPVTPPDVPSLPAPGGDVTIDIQAHDGCSHFVTQVVDGVRVGPSPWWLRQRLAQCGVRSINTVVDVTNFVMLELGQPLHAFDLDTLRGPELHIRWAEQGERLTTLDDQDRELLATDLLIADAERPVSLAAVMGGADTEVSEATTRVLIEGAVWDPLTVRRTSRRLNLVSEASLRFERRVDPAGAERAVARAVALLEEIADGAAGAVAADGAPAGDGDAVRFDPVWCARFLGLPELTGETQAAYLERLGCEVTPDGDELVVTPPSWRGDLQRPADLAEEVARIHGYGAIPATVPDLRQAGGLSPAQRAERRIRDAALAGGLHEVRSRPFSGDDVLVGVAPSDGRVVLENPLAKDAAAMTPSLVEGLLQTVRRNVGQGRPGVALFELGRVFRPQGDVVEEALKAFGDAWLWRDTEGRSLPTQPRALGLAAQGLKHGPDWLATDETWSVHDLLAVLDEVTRRVAPSGGADWRLVREAAVREGLHPGRTARLLLRGVEVGVVGQLHPEEADRRDLPEPVVVAELLLEPLLAHVGEDDEPAQAAALVRHPAMTVDVALVADDDVSFDTLAAAVRAGAGELLDELWWFDEYRGEQLGEGRRSVAVKLRLQAPDRQLTDQDAQDVIAAVGREAQRIGATLRG